MYDVCTLVGQRTVALLWIKMVVSHVHTLNLAVMQVLAWGMQACFVGECFACNILNRNLSHQHLVSSWLQVISTQPTDTLCYSGGLLDHIDFVPSVEPSQQQQAAIHCEFFCWFECPISCGSGIVFGGPALLLAISAALPPAEKRERRNRRVAKGDGTAPSLKDGTQRPKAD